MEALKAQAQRHPSLIGTQGSRAEPLLRADDAACAGPAHQSEYFALPLAGELWQKRATASTAPALLTEHNSPDSKGVTMTTKRLITSGSKWEPLLGYSRAVVAGNTIYVSGTCGVEADGSVAPDMYGQARRALQIISEALAQAGAGMTDVVRTRIFVTDASKFDEIAKAHGEIFGEIRPATTIVEVSKLVDAAFVVEIEAVAVL
jgi:enamine deaminase RidA (YjgF/YER057c/UK114 family)